MATYTAKVENIKVALSQLIRGIDESDMNKDESVLLKFQAVDGKVTSSFQVNVPLWYSTSELLDSVDSCTSQGGYPFRFNTHVFLTIFTLAHTATCVKYYAINNACTKIKIDSQKNWTVDSSKGGDGCYFPFTSLGDYAQVACI